MPSAKATTKQNSLEALLLYVELDKADPILDDVLAGLSNKQPKIIASTLAALTALYHAYGVKIVEPKPTLKALPKVFGHADKNVRAEATKLTVELYRWLRGAMKKLIWDELKPVQQQDLEKLFAAVDAEPSPKQERLLRTQQAEAEAQAAAATAADEPEGVEAEEEAEVEVFDLAEPKDVISKIPSTFYENMNSAKWKDRKEALDAVYAEANTEKIKDGHYDELVSVLAKSMKDANIAVVTVAANTIDVLAKGLRRSFAKYRSKVMPPIMERLKEKKQSVTDALGAALDAVFASSSLSDCLDDILEFLRHKNPTVKAETLNFLIRCLKTTREVPSKPETKSTAEAATKLLTDSVEATRSGGAEVLGTLMKIIGERAMNPYMDGLDDIRKTKIKEYCDKAEVKAKDKPKAAPAAAKSGGGPGLQKRTAPASTKKPPAGAGPGLKPPSKRASTPPVEKPTSPPSKLGPAKSIPSKLGGLPKPGLAAPTSTGLKKKLPGAGAPPTLASPRRTITPHSEDDTAPSTAPTVPKLGRGLVGRPLGKAPAPQTEQGPATASATATPANTFSSADRAELEALRNDRDRLQRTLENLQSDKTRMTAQIHELQNHNAELIEDHTRDVLSIKAKETQLVRARSDAEAAEQSAQRLQRENDRLKRELSRAVRQTPASPSGSSFNTGGGGMEAGDQIFRDSGSSAGGHSNIHAGRPSGPDRYDSYRSNGSNRSSRYFATGMGSPSEEKENGAPSMMLDGSAKMPAPVLGRQGSSSGNGSGRVGVTSRNGEAGVGGGGGEGHEPPVAVADWKRAGEVTSALKARIEQMKVRPSIHLTPYPF